MSNAVILIIEDHPVTSKMLRIVLESDGYVVIEAINGEQALMQIKNNKPDLILQDLLLPDIESTVLNKRLHDYLGEDIPIIALSGFLNKIDEMHAIDSGFSDCLIKPVEPTHLLKVIRSYLPVGALGGKTSGRGERILIADDEPIQLKLLSLHLKQAGFQVDTAIDGDDAIRQAKENPPAAIISDILMPGMDGFELCLKIRQDPMLQHLPVILISSQYLEEPDQILANKVGANAFVNRAGDYQSLIEILTQNLKRKSPTLETVPDQIFKEEHIHSLIRQLERQVYTQSGLIQRNALQAAQLNLLKSIVGALTGDKPSLASVPHNILEITLDASGISKGVLYLNNNNQLKLYQLMGYREADKEELRNFFNHKELLLEAMNAEKTLRVPSTDVAKSITDDLLARAHVNSAIIVPLVFGKDCLGVLFLGSKEADVVNVDFVSFIQSLGKQIAQTIALAQVFKKLAVSEQRYRLLLDKASCGIIISTADGVILEANEQLERIFGLPKTQIIGKQFQQFLVQTDREYFEVLTKKLQREKSFYQNESRVQHPSGVFRDIEYSIIYIEIGEESYLQTIINDITDQKRLRSRSILSDKLATVGTLAAGVVHEINNPMTWILQNLALMKTELQDLMADINRLLSNVSEETMLDKKINKLMTFTEVVKHTLVKLADVNDESIEGADRVHDIVRSLKNYARVDDETAALVDVHGVINMAIKMAYHEFKNYAKLERDFAPSMPPTMLQRGKLQQVLLNLILNAAQALTESHSEKKCICIKTRVNDNRIQIDISDNGSGISQENLAHIFEPFFTTKPVGIGTGLGLPICQEILHSLGGEIKVQSQIGEGSTFTVLIPLIEENRGLNISYSNKDVIQISHGTILVVDDEPSLLKTMQRILEPHHEVVLAKGGYAALEFLSRQPERFDVIVSDLSMPDVNGKDLYFYLLDKHPGLEQRIIFVTGGVDLLHFKQFLTDIKNPCIEKPFTKDQLLYMVDKMMSVIVSH